ncbi:conserved hypothetical protein [Ricinus communis]|uniref:Uncharacterized protein n=1 Tax=Ricinus communis TaxID=3988 RepID=B9RNX2_RICCO|nr:conserved hypothetical protein [Ricinus communis]
MERPKPKIEKRRRLSNAGNNVQTPSFLTRSSGDDITFPLFLLHCPFTCVCRHQPARNANHLSPLQDLFTSNLDFSFLRSVS